MDSVFQYKFVVLRFSRHFSEWNDIWHSFNYKIDNAALEFATSYRNLEITVNRALKFHCHVKDLVCRAAGLAIIFYVLL